MASKKTKGRQKVEMKRIENQDDRLITFSKRRSGIYKKASELATLTGAEIAIAVFSPAGKPFSFGHPSVESVINRFLEDSLNMDSTYHLVEAHLDEKKEKGLKLKSTIKEMDSKGWWDTAIEELNIQQLIELEKKFNELQMTLCSKIAENTSTVASSSQAPETGHSFACTIANDQNAPGFPDKNH
ncbi:agamous-like MADS-box protein AGL29 [Populus alba x Populus x berolinensis]|uniref:Agamous-like MADS-box protein AGL29 n=1 Tax=Populus alba x Populus x berolinensis TaxID=444605 RepID=A0AAD6RPM7_9ROSI|nr:agamous-like MADS-box protein AGL29 [Populus alba x Populus x berolinensis]